MRCGGKLGCMNEGDLEVKVTGGGTLGFLCYECADQHSRMFETHSEVNRQVHLYAPVVGEPTRHCHVCGWGRDIWQHGVTEHRARTRPCGG